MTKVRAVAFDVIETLFSLEPLRPRVVALGLQGEALELWFAQTLRDAFALSAAGGFEPFKTVARGSLEALLATKGHPIEPAAIEATLEGFGSLTPHADVGPALTLLRQRQVPAYAVSNGSAVVTQKLFEHAGLAELIAGVLSVDDVQLFKPRAEVYQHAAKVARVALNEMAMVAAHAWDVQGAQRAGMVGAFIARKEPRFNAALGEPDVAGSSLVTLCEHLLK